MVGCKKIKVVYKILSVYVSFDTPSELIISPSEGLTSRGCMTQVVGRGAHWLEMG